LVFTICAVAALPLETKVPEELVWKVKGSPAAEVLFSKVVE
jgi:hypothetical protein